MIYRDILLFLHSKRWRFRSLGKPFQVSHYWGRDWACFFWIQLKDLIACNWNCSIHSTWWNRLFRHVGQVSVRSSQGNSRQWQIKGQIRPYWIWRIWSFVDSKVCARRDLRWFRITEIWELWFPWLTTVPLLFLLGEKSFTYHFPTKNSMWEDTIPNPLFFWRGCWGVKEEGGGEGVCLSVFLLDPN